MPCRRRALGLAFGFAIGCTQAGPPGWSGDEPIAYACHENALLSAFAGSGYHFTVAGANDPEVVLDALHGSGERPGPGDVVRVDRFAFVLDEPGAYRVVVADGRVSLAKDGGPERVVAVEIDGPGAFAGWSDAQRRSIRGVRVRGEGPGLDRELSRLDLERVVVSLDLDAITAQGVATVTAAVPTWLPAGLRYLEIDLQGRSRGDEATADPVEDPRTGLASVSRFAGLRYLVLRESSGSPRSSTLDLRGVAENRALELLRVSTFTREPDHFEALSSLAALRVLDLSAAHRLVDLAPIAALPELRVLDISNTRVESLAALAGHATLEAIDATSTRVSSLPAVPPPGLRRLSLLGTEVARAATEAFVASAPAALVARRWNEALAGTIACADRILVRTGGLCHRGDVPERTLFELRDPIAVHDALPMLFVREDEPMGSCMCCGEPTIEFWRGDDLLTAVGVHHGRSLRWAGWPGDGRLTDGTALCEWLRAHGVTDACAG